ncbi:MAG: hypothetical protein OHK0017_04210 [Patescibacteria group bacterium]
MFGLENKDRGIDTKPKYWARFILTCMGLGIGIFVKLSDTAQAAPVEVTVNGRNAQSGELYFVGNDQYLVTEAGRLTPDFLRELLRNGASFSGTPSICVNDSGYPEIHGVLIMPVNPNDPELSSNIRARIIQSDADDLVMPQLNRQNIDLDRLYLHGSGAGNVSGDEIFGSLDRSDAGSFLSYTNDRGEREILGIVVDDRRQYLRVDGYGDTGLQILRFFALDTNGRTTPAVLLINPNRTYSDQARIVRLSQFPGDCYSPSDLYDLVDDWNSNGANNDYYFDGTYIPNEMLRLIQYLQNNRSRQGSEVPYRVQPNRR